MDSTDAPAEKETVGKNGRVYRAKPAKAAPETAPGSPDSSVLTPWRQIRIPEEFAAVAAVLKAVEAARLTTVGELWEAINSGKAIKGIGSFEADLLTQRIERLPGFDGKRRAVAPEPAKSGAVKFDWNEFVAARGKVILRIDDIGTAHDAMGHHEYQAAHRLWEAFQKLTDAWREKLCNPAKDDQ